jgi:exonuclease SbcD
VKGAAAETRYPGSLIQLDFGERGQDKSLVIVEAHAGKPPKTETIPVDAGCKLIEVNATLDDLDRLRSEVGTAYVRVNLSVDSPVPGIADRVREALPNALDIRLVLPETEKRPIEPSLRDLDPRKQFASYYSTTHGTEPGEDLLGAFDRVYEEVSG